MGDHYSIVSTIWISLENLGIFKVEIYHKNGGFKRSKLLLISEWSPCFIKPAKYSGKAEVGQSGSPFLTRKSVHFINENCCLLTQIRLTRRTNHSTYVTRERLQWTSMYYNKFCETESFKFKSQITASQHQNSVPKDGIDRCISSYWNNLQLSLQ